ncbi:hypothetical protein Syun_023707 [Stephania yunnanensis]|uniref:Uncharacterized protein n=1 Tax=Stephania yunnanensis TaxID=152371 RepID=A0AAP0FA90_9MAGN
MPFEIVVLQVGNYIPISPVRDDVATAYKKGMEWKASKMLLPYKQLCSEKKVKFSMLTFKPIKKKHIMKEKKRKEKNELTLMRYMKVEAEIVQIEAR